MQVIPERDSKPRSMALARVGGNETACCVHDSSATEKTLPCNNATNGVSHEGRAQAWSGREVGRPTQDQGDGALVSQLRDCEGGVDQRRRTIARAAVPGMALGIRSKT